MLNRLWVRLTLVLIAATLLGIGTVAALASYGVEAQTNALLAQQRAAAQLELTDQLTEYHNANGGWGGVERVMRRIVVIERARRWPREDGGGFSGPRPRRPQVYVLADATGNVVFDSDLLRTNRSLTPEERELALPLRTGDSTIGFLLVNSPRELLALEARDLFLTEIRRNLLRAVLIACALTVGIGALAGRALARPLGALADAAHAFSRRDWRHRAVVSGTKEIGDVALAFNSMAESLERADADRRNMTADIAHELRTPLTVIQGNLRAMLDGIYPLERHEISTVYDETRLLSRLVDDLRELTLAEAGQLAMQPSRIDIGELLASTLEPLRLLAEERGLRFVIGPVDAQLLASADAERVRQVLRNIVTNAFRHTPQGGQIDVSATREAQAVRIAVRDTGEGILSEDLPYIFDRFYRADKSRARASGGSGLGLPISKALIDAMGGTIGALSTPGTGSTFWFTLPVAN
jgi:two-component system OmpR family sensor kinase/two-component system sensor histidine kinase BaeS